MDQQKIGTFLKELRNEKNSRGCVFYCFFHFVIL